MSPIHHDHSADAAVAAMASLPPASDSVDTPRAAPTLRIGVEFARQWHRRRTQVALALMVALPLILAGAFALGTSDNRAPTSSLIDLAQSSATNFVIVTLFFSASFLLIVIVSLYFGDAVASEASWSSLKYLLAMPVPRMRLLRQKLVVAALLSAISIAVLTTMAAGVGAVLYGSGPLVTPTGATFTGGSAWVRVLVALGAITVQLVWVAGVAFLMTVVTTVPLGAVGTAVLLSIVSQILDQITALGSLRSVLPTHYSFAWTGALVDPPNWADMTRGAFSSLVYAAVLVTVAFLLFRRKDITS